MTLDLNLVTVIVTAIPATLAAVAAFIQALRNNTQMAKHNFEMSAKVDGVADAVNGRMDQALKAANIKGHQDERDGKG
jgi:hypothetical protein